MRRFFSIFTRRSGDTWFVAVMNGGGGRKNKISLEFVGKGVYDIFALFENSRSPESTKTVSRKVESGEIIPVKMRSPDGFAVMIKPVAD